MSDDTKRKTQMLMLRLTDRQLDMLREAAQREMMPTATWARRALVLALSKALKTPIRGNLYGSTKVKKNRSRSPSEATSMRHSGVASPRAA